MKILITGGTGIISLSLVKAFISKGAEVYALNRGSHPEKNLFGVKNIIGDIHNSRDISLKLEGRFFDVIIDCLGMDVYQLKKSIDIFENKCRHYVYISSAGVYSRQGKIIDESQMQNGNGWRLMKHKAECERYIINRLSPDKYMIIRPTVTYGDYRFPFPVVSRKNQWSLLERICLGRPIVACDNVKFSIMHCDDFGDTVCRLVQNENAYGEAFHISNREVIEWDDVIKIAGEYLGCPPQIVHIPVELYKRVFSDLYCEIKYNKSSELILSTDKTEKFLDCKAPKYISSQDGVRRSIDSLKKQNLSAASACDDEWNLKCDSVIYLCYKKNKFMAEEMKNAQIYIQSLNRDYLKQIKRYISKAYVKYPFSIACEYLKDLIKPIYRKVKGLWRK